VLHIVLTASPRLSDMRLADALVEFLSRDVGIGGVYVCLSHAGSASKLTTV